MSWEGIDYPGLHQPLTDMVTFNKVQDLLAARAARGTRERRHNHYLKGTLFCGVCGRGLSFQLAKGRYEYLYCPGQKNRNPTGLNSTTLCGILMRSPPRAEVERTIVLYSESAGGLTEFSRWG